jgi:hypothetical protein
MVTGNGDGLIPFKKAGSDTVQLIHAKPAIESHKRGHGRQHLAAVTPMPPPTPPTKMPLSLLSMCTTVACTAAVSRIDKSQPVAAKLRPAPTQHALPASHVAIPHTQKGFTRIHNTI